LVLALGEQRPDAVKKILLALGDAGRIVDLYPLELLIYVLERRAELLPGISCGNFIKNKPELEAKVWVVEEPVTIKLPINVRIKAFALEGGGSPGYCLQPGPPDAYVLEFGDAGSFSAAFRGEMRDRTLVDRVRLTIRDDS
jgi:hypothetical protein